jgi:Uma2 family endonuclease
MEPMAAEDRRLTYADFLLFPDDGMRHEIIDGVHYVTGSPNLGHQDLVGRLHLAIGNHLATRRHQGRVFLSPLDVVMSNYDVIEPDLLFVSGDQQAILTEANVQGAPALLVEVLSPSTRRRDEGIKRQLFDRVGVREYWMVDPLARRVVVFRRSDGGALEEAEVLRCDTGATLTTSLLPDLTLAIDALFEVW